MSQVVIAPLQIHQALVLQALDPRIQVPQNLALLTLALQGRVHLPPVKRPVVPPVAEKQTLQHLKLMPLGV